MVKKASTKRKSSKVIFREYYAVARPMKKKLNKAKSAKKYSSELVDRY